jgi:hypothetical protein
VIIVLQSEGVHAWVHTKRLAHCDATCALGDEGAPVLGTCSTWVDLRCIVRSKLVIVVASKQVVGVVVAILDLFLYVLIKIIVVVVRKLV